MGNAIERLTVGDTITAATKFAVSVGGNDVSVTAAILSAYLQTVLPTAGVKTTQYNAPVATGFSVAVRNDAESTWLILTPGATYATGTIVLPLLSIAADKQEVLVNCTQIVTTLTVDGNGATVRGAPTTLAAANAFFLLRYDAVNETWNRVG